MEFGIDDEAHARVETFSQEGEDIFLRRMMQTRPAGFYVDIGAHHPFRFSNTWILYKQGWRGINIDPNPGTKALFDRHRPLDINLDEIVSDIDGVSTPFDIYKEPAFNSAIQERRLGLQQFFSHTVQRRTVRLDTLLRSHLPAETAVDFMSVDVEGLDLAVIKSNDWTAVRPTWVMVETIVDLRQPDANEIVAYMATVGYKLRAYLYLTAVFIPEGMAHF